MTDLDLSYKIIILKLLSKAEDRMSTTQLCDFMTGYGICDYFTARNAISSLEISEMITGYSTNNNTYHTINEKGEESLRLFPEKISDGIISDIDAYFKQNGGAIKKDNALTADYIKLHDNSYMINLRKLENKKIIIDLSFVVSNEDAAKSICTNWRVKHNNIYAAIMDELLQ